MNFTDTARGILADTFVRVNGQKYVLFDKAQYQDPVLEALTAAHELAAAAAVREARIDENQRCLDRIDAWNNRVPDPNEVTAASFGRGGAGMVESAYEQSFKDRIAALQASPTNKQGGAE